MKNADKPINPIYGIDNSLGTEADENYLFQNKSLIGLTKREYFAGLAMQGMIANTDTYVQDKSVIAKLSIEHADELLKQLENENI